MTSLRFPRASRHPYLVAQIVVEREVEVSNLAGIGGDDLAEEERGHADALARAAPDVLGPQHRATAVGHFYEGRSLEVILAGRGESYFPARHRFIRALARVVGRSAHGDRTVRHRGFMAETNQGLTKTYNALKDPANDDPRILALRGLHEGMDRAVLEAYG